MTMPTRLLGKTVLTDTALGLGLAALGRPSYINLGHAADLARDYDVVALTPYSMPPGPPEFATSTPPAPTAAPSCSSAAG